MVWQCWLPSLTVIFNSLLLTVVYNLPFTAVNGAEWKYNNGTKQPLFTVNGIGQPQLQIAFIAITDRGKNYSLIFDCIDFMVTVETPMKNAV